MSELTAEELAVLNAIATLAEEDIVASPSKVGQLMDPPRPGSEVMAIGRGLYRLQLVVVHVPRAGLAAFRLTAAGREAIA